MARPRKIDTDDRYNEESLNLNSDSKSFSYDDEESVPELGAADPRGRFARLNDRSLFGDMHS
jgi:hypothetical protein